MLVRVGGAYGHPDNARRLLAAGHWVVCYPGGAREALKRHASDRYRLCWEVSRGFVRIAQETGVPIIPFAAAGVDDTFDVCGAVEGSGKLLMGHPKYDLPRLSSGNYGLPRAVPFLFRFGDPVDLARELDDAPAGEDAAIRHAHRRIWHRAQRHLDETVAAWHGRFAKDAA